jgi:hypothetical protein
MTSRIDIERVLDGYLADGPERVGDQALLRALDAIDQTKQRRDLLAPWRFEMLITFPRLAAAVLVAVVAIGGGAYLLGQRSGVGGIAPTPVVSPTAPSPSPSAVAAANTPTPSVDTSSWLAFTSANYGFSISYPSNWTTQPGAGHWAYAKPDDAAIDIFWSSSGWPELTGFETKIPVGMTADSFLQAFTADAMVHACYPPKNLWIQTTVDGHPASIAYAGCNEHFYSAEGIVVIGKRIWIFDLYGPDRSLIVPFLSTVHIDPTAVVD